MLSATPVIDTKSPPQRAHVAVKLKKLQKEAERSRKIERDNLMLLQKLNYIMTKHWQDNYLPPQPTFLSRIGVYRSSESQEAKCKIQVRALPGKVQFSVSNYFFFGMNSQICKENVVLGSSNICKKIGFMNSRNHLKRWMPRPHAANKNAWPARH